MQKFFSKVGVSIGVSRTMIPSVDGVNCRSCCGSEEDLESPRVGERFVGVDAQTGFGEKGFKGCECSCDLFSRASYIDAVDMRRAGHPLRQQLQLSGQARGRAQRKERKLGSSCKMPLDAWIETSWRVVNLLVP